MDVVRALNRYRKTITTDSNAFQILCYVYKDRTATEDLLRSCIDIPAVQLKNSIRELFQADLLRLDDDNGFILTPFAESILSELGVDRLIAPFIIDEISSSESELKELKHFINISFQLEPELARYTTISLRNVRVFLSHSSELSAQDKDWLVWSALIHPDSKLRLILKNDRYSFSEFLTTFRHEQTHLVPNITAKFSAACQLLDETDALMLRASTDVIKLSEFSRISVHVLGLRLWNYCESLDRDSLLEKCFQANQSVVNSLVRLIEDISPISASLLIRVVKQIRAVSSSLSNMIVKVDLAMMISSIITTKIAQASESFDRLRKSNHSAWSAPTKVLMAPDASTMTETVQFLRHQLSRLSSSAVSDKDIPEMLELLAQLKKITEQRS
jgi:hypothetical protein